MNLTEALSEQKSIAYQEAGKIGNLLGMQFYTINLQVKVQNGKIVHKQMEYLETEK